MLKICPTCRHTLSPFKGIKVDKRNGVVLLTGGAMKLLPHRLNILIVLNSRSPNFITYAELRSIICKNKTKIMTIPALMSYASRLRGDIEGSGFHIEMRKGVGLRLMENLK